MIFCDASLHSAAVFFFNGNARTKRLRVSTATKMKLIPWLYRDSFCISSKSPDLIIQSKTLDLQPKEAIFGLFEFGISLTPI